MKIRASIMVALAAAAFALNSQALVIEVDSTLDGNQEVGPVATNATGTATLQFDTIQNSLNFSLSVSGIFLDDITFPDGPLAFGTIGPVHFHNGVAGQNGPIILPFADMALYSATLDGFELQASQVVAPADLEGLLGTGSVYINVHTLANGGGEIRGQLTSAVPEPTTFALFGLASLGLMLRRRKAA